MSEESERFDQLLQAIEAGDVHVVSTLIEQHPSLLRAENESGRTALHEAVFESNMEIATLLLQNGAAVGSQEAIGWSPLHEAVYNSTTEMVNLLLRFGGSVVDGKDDRGATPLHGAADDGFDDMVEILLRHGANCDVRNNYGQTPLDIARARGKAKAVAVIERYVTEKR